MMINSKLPNCPFCKGKVVKYGPLETERQVLIQCQGECKFQIFHEDAENIYTGVYQDWLDITDKQTKEIAHLHATIVTLEKGMQKISDSIEKYIMEIENG